jgi:pimeloyl-ACP methyl ester carboxylesterase
VVSDSGKSMTDLMSDLKAIPFKPRPLGGRTSTALVGLLDVLPMVLDTQSRTAGKIYPYPNTFKSVTFPSLDDTPLAGKLAVHHDGKPRPGIVFCHGLLGNKNQTLIRNVAIKAFRDWDFNVLALDLRIFGESRLLSEALPTGGWKEAEDIIGAARLLGSFSEVTTVGVSGYSMGAGSTMVAAGMDSGEFITGGVMAWNGYSDTRRMVAHITRVPMPWEPFMVAYPLFQTLFLLKRHDLGKEYSHIKNFGQIYSHACSEQYCLTEDEVFTRSSPMNYLDKVQIPTLHVHAEDDPIVPVREAEDNARIAKDNPNAEVWILNRGGHCAWTFVDGAWYGRVLRDFFNAWGLRG